ncbi:hypothetical protein OIU83_15200 [Flavobacterium sp. LS1R49]|uniref:Uncharacterized protein n=1 Tax=Flavobacterium shii TaxID=2987687 RepID=A0A9X2ZCT1_9FLAO|nr:hypothetical protein [Flavobacterium shii]MCV9929011.1 hypothetical protein [Flavobacterium shii]
MIIKRIIYIIISTLSVLNSIYLSNLYLEAFMLDDMNQELSSNFILIIVSPLFIFIIIATISYFIYKIRNVNFNFRSDLIFILCGPVFFLYKSLQFDNPRQLLQGVGFLIEILSIAFTIGRDKDSLLFKLFGVVFLWVVVGTICFSLTGIFEQYLGYKDLRDSNIRLLFTAIFYHLFNACFLFYSYLPKSMTEKGILKMGGYNT